MSSNDRPRLPIEEALEDIARSKEDVVIQASTDSGRLVADRVLESARADYAYRYNPVRSEQNPMERLVKEWNIAQIGSRMLATAAVTASLAVGAYAAQRYQMSTDAQVAEAGVVQQAKEYLRTNSQEQRDWQASAPHVDSVVNGRYAHRMPDLEIPQFEALKDLAAEHGVTLHLRSSEHVNVLDAKHSAAIDAGGQAHCQIVMGGRWSVHDAARMGEQQPTSATLVHTYVMGREAANCLAATASLQAPQALGPGAGAEAVTNANYEAYLSRASADAFGSAYADYWADAKHVPTESKERFDTYVAALRGANPLAGLQQNPLDRAIQGFDVLESEGLVQERSALIIRGASASELKAFDSSAAMALLERSDVPSIDQTDSSLLMSVEEFKDRITDKAIVEQGVVTDFLRQFSARLHDLPGIDPAVEQARLDRHNLQRIAMNDLDRATSQVATEHSRDMRLVLR